MDGYGYGERTDSDTNQKRPSPCLITGVQFIVGEQKATMGRSVCSKLLREPIQKTTFNLWKLQVFKTSDQWGWGSSMTLLLYTDREWSRREKERMGLAFRSGQRISQIWTLLRTSSDNCSAWKFDSRIWREQFTKFGLKFLLPTFVSYTNRCPIGYLSAVKTGHFPYSINLLLKLSLFQPALRLQFSPRSGQFYSSFGDRSRSGQFCFSCGDRSWSEQLWSRSGQIWSAENSPSDVFQICPE